MIDVLYLAHNRLEFTRFTFELLLQNTDWPLVDKLVIYDDESIDGTAHWLAEKIVERNRARNDPPAELRHVRYGSPVAVMNDYLATSAADWFAKIDSDIAVPEGWLNALVGVLARNPEVELLGMEAGQTEMAGRDGKEWDGVYRFEPSSHIGGVGIMQREFFRMRPAIPAKGRFGFTEWQHHYRPARGWITPDLHVPQLDRIPLEPWASLTKGYIERGWARKWPPMDERWCREYYDWMPEVAREATSTS